MSYKQFSDENIRGNLLHDLLQLNLVNNADGYQQFFYTGFETLNGHASCKEKHRCFPMNFAKF